MMASRRDEAGRPRFGGRGKRAKGGMTQYVIIAAVLVALAGGTVLLVSTSGKKAPAKPKSGTADTEATGEKPRKAKKSSARERSLARRSLRSEERERKRRERRARRSDRTGRSRKGRTSKRSAVIAHRVEAILQDGTSGERVALVDNRRLKAGDEVDGRRIVSVGPSSVTVEYKGNTSSVRVGQQLY